MFGKFGFKVTYMILKKGIKNYFNFFSKILFTILEKITDEADSLIRFACKNLSFFKRTFIKYSSYSFSHYLLLLDFVLKRALQHGHLNPVTVIKILHKVHLFWPYSYFEPFGILLPFKLSHTPLQTYTIMIGSPQRICDNKGS